MMKKFFAIVCICGGVWQIRSQLDNVSALVAICKTTMGSQKNGATIVYVLFIGITSLALHIHSNNVNAHQE